MRKLKAEIPAKNIKKQNLCFITPFSIKSSIKGSKATEIALPRWPAKVVEIEKKKLSDAQSKIKVIEERIASLKKL